MKKALCFTGKALGTVAKVLFCGVILVGHFIMNCVGVLVCAITE